MKTKKTVWVLAISHEHGVDTFVGETKKSMEKELARYCRYWWDDEITMKQNFCKKPRRNVDIIEKYFDYVEGETYDLSLSDVQK